MTGLWGFDRAGDSESRVCLMFDVFLGEVEEMFQEKCA